MSQGKKSGWICSYRSIWKHPFFQGNGMRVAVWHWLLHHAAWKPAQHRAGHVMLTIQRGEVCFSQQQIQDDTGASRRQVRDVIEWLISTKKAAKIGANERANGTANARANAKTILLIEKYEEYQGEKDEGANGTANDAATEGPTKEQVNNYNKIQEDKSSLSSGDDDPPEQPDEIDQAFDAYQMAAEAAGWPQVRIRSKARRSRLKARLGECGGLQGWRAALAKARASPHCCGDNERGWIADFDFLTSASKFAKLMEGSYDKRTPSAPEQGRGRPTSLASIAARRQLGLEDQNIVSEGWRVS